MKITPRIAIILGLIVAPLATPGLVGGRAAEAAPTSPAGQLAGDKATVCVRPLMVARTSAVDAAGRVVANRALTRHATAYAYATGTGDDVREIVPPEGWSPLYATDAELRAYGFPPRPADAQSRAAWEKNMAAWKRAGKPEMCQTNVSAAVTNTSTSQNWAGGMAVNGSATASTFTSTDGRWSQPSFSSYCGTGAGYSIWSGLGGYNSGRLIQSGVDNYDSDGNNGRMFWEMISPEHDNTELRWTDVTVPAGHQVQSYVSYDEGDAFMWVADMTTGVSHSVLLSSYAGQAASGYYDGTTADFITEAPSVNHVTRSLMRPVGDQTYYGYATVNGQPIANFWSWRINQGTGGRIQLSGFDGIHAWNDFWRNCT